MLPAKRAIVYARDRELGAGLREGHPHSSSERASFRHRERNSSTCAQVASPNFAQHGLSCSRYFFAEALSFR
jgi:hypothetical protein